MKHQAQSIAIVVEFWLNRPLCNPEEIHVAYFGQQYVIHKLLHIAFIDTLLLMAHGVCAPQAYRLSIENEPSLSLPLCIHRKIPHPELLFPAVQKFSLFVQQPNLDLIQPRIRIAPTPCARNMERDRKPVAPLLDKKRHRLMIHIVCLCLCLRQGISQADLQVGGWVVGQRREHRLVKILSV